MRQPRSKEIWGGGCCTVCGWMDVFRVQTGLFPFGILGHRTNARMNQRALTPSRHHTHRITGNPRAQHAMEPTSFSQFNLRKPINLWAKGPFVLVSPRLGLGSRLQLHSSTIAALSPLPYNCSHIIYSHIHNGESLAGTGQIEFVDLDGTKYIRRQRTSLRWCT